MQRKSSQSRGKSDDHIHVNQTPSMKKMTGRNHHEGDLTAVQWVAICFVVITTISTMGLLWHHHFLFANPTYSYSDCELYMAPSLIPNAGRGVFAGKRFDRLAEVDVSASISLPIEELYYQQIFNYVYGDDDDNRVVALLGAGMIFNHRDPHTVQHFGVNNARQGATSPHTTHYKMRFHTLRATEAGEELFASYGEEWFWTRGIEYDNNYDGTAPIKYKSVRELHRVGHCLSDIYVKRSTIPRAGSGVFARRSFSKGDIVSISPLIGISKEILRKIDNDTVISNYCFSVPHFDDVLLPIGTAAMINHGGIDRNEDLSNLQVEFYEWNANNRQVIGAGIGKSYRTIDAAINNTDMSSPFGKYDFAYIATRDINAEEELFISYGTDWIIAWENYMTLKRQYELRQRIEKSNGDEYADKAPLFRHFISM